MSEKITPVYDLATIEPQASDQNPAAVFLAKHASEHTRRSYERELSTMAAFLGAVDCYSCAWGKVRYKHTAAIRTALQNQVSPKTGKPLSYKAVNHFLAALRGVLKTAWELEQMTAEQYQRAVNIQDVKGKRVSHGRALEYGELQSLSYVCKSDKTPAGARDRAIIALGYSLGLRRDELAGLDLADYDKTSGRILVQGKGNRERVAFVSNGAKVSLDGWLTIRGSGAGAMFQPINKGGNIQARRMTAQAVYNVITQRGNEAGLSKFSPHDLRRTFATGLLSQGVDLVTVSRMMGHARVDTTALYDLRSEETIRDAAKMLSFPV